MAELAFWDFFIFAKVVKSTSEILFFENLTNFEKNLTFYKNLYNRYTFFAE